MGELEMHTDFQFLNSKEIWLKFTWTKLMWFTRCEETLILLCHVVKITRKVLHSNLHSDDPIFVGKSVIDWLIVIAVSICLAGPSILLQFPCLWLTQLIKRKYSQKHNLFRKDVIF